MFSVICFFGLTLSSEIILHDGALAAVLGYPEKRMGNQQRKQKGMNSVRRLKGKEGRGVLNMHKRGRFAL